MAEPQGQKRQRAEESSQSGNQPLKKKFKTASEVELDAWFSWTYPPEFYDRLCKIDITTLALCELRRRTSTQRFYPPRPVVSSSGILSGIQRRRDVVRFARHGGPDLSDLRGYPYPPVECLQAATMNTGQGNDVSIAAQSVVTPATQAARMTRTSQKTSPYDSNFDSHLEQFNIHPRNSTMRPDLAEVLAAIALPLPSQSHAEFSQDAFETFVKTIVRARTKHEMMVNVLPKLLGDDVSEYVTGHQVTFGNCTLITDGTVMPAKPTLYDGVRPHEVHDSILDQLAGLITPSIAGENPILPNFFVEVASRNSPYVAELKSRYYGAIGARALHRLQNVGKQLPEYDGIARTYSAMICGSLLQIFVHHTTAPAEEGFLPNFHMTTAKSYALDENLDTFIKGVTAFRNCRMLAKQWRDVLTAAANSRWFPVYPTPTALDFVEDPASQSPPRDKVENAFLVADDGGR